MAGDYLKGFLCCTSGFKADLMHGGLSSGGAWHIGYYQSMPKFSLSSSM